MTSARDEFPEIAAIVDSIRASGGTVTAAWVELEETGQVLAGKRPAYVMTEVEVEPEAMLRSRAATEERRALAEVQRLKARRK